MAALDRFYCSILVILFKFTLQFTRLALTSVSLLLRCNTQ